MTEPINPDTISETEAHKLIRLFAAKFHWKYKLWKREDIEGEIDEYVDLQGNTREFTDEEREQIVQEVFTSYEWETLDEATDEDWETLQQAIEEAVQSIDNTGKEIS